MVKMGAFQQGMDRAQRLTEKNIQKMEHSWQRLEARTKFVVQSIVGALGVIGAKRAFDAFIENTVKAEQLQAQLAAVLRSTGASAWATQGQLNSMAQAMSSLNGKSIFDAGQINEAQTRMLSFTNVAGKVFPEAMQAAIDMATRMGMDVTFRHDRGLCRSG